MLRECIDTKKHIFLCCMNALIQRNTSFYAAWMHWYKETHIFYAAWMHWYKEIHLFMLHECIDTKKHNIFFMLYECIDTKKHVFLCCMSALIQRNISFYAAWMHWYNKTHLFMLHACFFPLAVCHTLIVSLALFCIQISDLTDIHNFMSKSSFIYQAGIST